MSWVSYKPQKFLSHSSELSKIIEAAWSGSGQSPLPRCRLLTSQCVLTWQKEGYRAFWDLTNQSHLWGIHHHDLIISQRSNFQHLKLFNMNPLYWELYFKIWILMGQRYVFHNRKSAEGDWAYFNSNNVP